IASAVDRLRSKGVQQITAIPLYPQRATSSTGSSLDELYRVLRKSWNVAPVKIGGEFFAEPDFLNAFAEVASPVLRSSQAEFVLFSFHGLPERQIKKSDPGGSHCLIRPDCCDAMAPANAGCYRAQSFHTARALAERLGLTREQFSVSFQ